jgi:hypothetical protein
MIVDTTRRIQTGAFPTATTLTVRGEASRHTCARLLRGGYPSGGLRYDWLFVLATAIFGLGVILDARGHLQGTVDTTLLSPRHAPLYGGILLVGVFLAASFGRNRAAGHPWRRALPPGYELSLVGVLLFFFSGAADLMWHAVFGVETGLATLLSPTHVLLALAGGLVVSGPLRAATHRLAPGGAPGWTALSPALVAAAYVLGLVTILTAYAHPLVGTYAMQAPPSASRPVSLTQPLGVASILLQTALQMGMALVLVRNWRLPPGALTLLISASSLPVIVLSDQFGFVPGVLLSAVIAELQYLLLRPSATRPASFYLFAFSVPVVFYGLYFASLQVGYGVGWSSHLVAASVLVAGIAGLLIGWLVMPAPVLNESHDGI